jgi:hypothetical protein
MSTTSLKLPEDIKRLAAVAAEYQGITPHAFMVDAIRVAAINAEKRAGFVSDAVVAREAAVASGEGYDAKEVHAFLRVKAKGKAAARPKAKTWRG